MVDLRYMQQSDCAQIYEIEQGSIDTPWSQEQIKKLTTDNNCIARVACDGDIVVGYYSFTYIAAVGEGDINNIAVHKSYRRRGIGDMLMCDMLAQVKKLNLKEIYLEVRSDNTAAKAMYEKYGFVIYGERKKYYNGTADAILYSKH